MVLFVLRRERDTASLRFMHDVNDYDCVKDDPFTFRKVMLSSMLHGRIIACILEELIAVRSRSSSVKT